MLPIELGLGLATLAFWTGAIPTMKIICSWCRQEGKPELVGEKAPLDDARETHGICVAHCHDVKAHWQASIDAASRSGVATGLSSALFRWTGLLNVTKKMRS